MPGNTSKGVSQLARRVGRDAAAVSRWVQRPDWPFGSGPWSLAQTRKITKWAAELQPNQADEDDAPSRARAARLKILIERGAKLELEREILAGKHLDRAEVEAGVVRRAYAVRAALEALPRMLCAELVGLDERAIEAALEDAIRGALDRLSKVRAWPAAVSAGRQSKRRR